MHLTLRNARFRDARARIHQMWTAVQAERVFTSPAESLMKRAVAGGTACHAKGPS